MKANFPATRTYYERIEPLNPVFFTFGDSARFKIIRAVQLHNCEPPVSPATHEWIPFFQFLSTGVEDHWQVQQQYSSCKWACGQDEELAAAQLLHYGWVPKYNVKMGDPCLYKLHKQSWGIAIETQCPHTLDDRLTAACSTTAAVKARLDVKGIKPKHSDLFKVACQVFFSYQGWYVSIPAAIRQSILNKITSYVTHLLNAMGADAQIPSLDDPIELFSQEDFITLKWEDFSFLNVSQSQYNQRDKNNRDRCLAAIYERWPDPEAVLTYSEVEQFLSRTNIARAKDYGFLKVKREGHKVYYSLNYERSDS